MDGSSSGAPRVSAGKLSSFLYAFYPRRKPLGVTMTTPKVTPAKIGRSDSVPLPGRGQW